jgi:hypothetical protein
MKWLQKTHIFESPASTSWSSTWRYVLLRPLRPELDGQDMEAGDSKIWAISFEKAFSIREFKTTEKDELVLKTYQMNDNVFSENKRFTD